MTVLVTGGAGFIGSNFVLDWLAQSDEPIVNLDALTYAGNLENLAALEGDARHRFVHGDIGDRPLLDRLLAEHRPRAVVHFAAEGMLLVSPRIYRHFAERFGEKGDGTPSTLAADKVGTGIQREVIKAGWHELGPRKTNVHRYQVVRRSGQGGSSLSVMVIRAPQRFIEPVPPANPHLVKVNPEPNPDALS